LYHVKRKVLLSKLSTEGCLKIIGLSSREIGPIKRFLNMLANIEKNATPFT